MNKILAVMILAVMMGILLTIVGLSTSHASSCTQQMPGHSQTFQPSASDCETP